MNKYLTRLVIAGMTAAVVGAAAVVAGPAQASMTSRLNTAPVAATYAGVQSDEARNAPAFTFAFTQYATVSPSAGWSFVAGQFAGDNKTDVVGYHPSNGSLWAGRNVS